MAGTAREIVDYASYKYQLYEVSEMFYVLKTD